MPHKRLELRMIKPELERDLPLWGGLECTINRVNNTYYDQFKAAGHYDNAELIDTFKDLGLSAFRVPVLWERHEPIAGQKIDWTFTSNNLAGCIQHSINPILGLVHHGSGPDYASIETPDFAPRLAAYASRVVRQFPWVEMYTPVNEPLTTARFCGLYGHWYPHQRSSTGFVRILLNECKATVLAMRAIREVNPKALLVQTEDLGKTYSTPELKYQTKFENERRFLSIDLLCGRVTKQHPLWSYLLWSGASEGDLDFFIQNPCPPDILGFNYYVTSERYLDHRFERYPAHTIGGNHIQKYADVEAVRINFSASLGPYNLLKEAWNRYSLPIALTEVHLNSTPEEQLKWIMYLNEAASRLSQEGVELRGLTLWALTGAFNWSKLLTVNSGEYESGLFKVQDGIIEETPLKQLFTDFTSGEDFAAGESGWWEKDTRYAFK